MELTRFTDVGLRIVMRLAADEDPVTSRQIATELHVPYSHVAKVVARLSELGVIHTRRGRTGGLAITSLGRNARVGWLARELEGADPVVDCEHPQPCPLRSACLLRTALAQAQSAFYDDLDRHRVDDLVSADTVALFLPLRRTSTVVGPQVREK